MNDLLTAISNGVNSLQRVETSVNQLRTRSDRMLPIEVYDNWEKLSRLHNSLESSKAVLKCRDEAWKVLDGLSTHIADGGLKLIDEYCCEWTGQVVPFGVVCKMSLMSYVTWTWALYDRLSNVTGRLAGNANIALANPGCNDPKLVENFLSTSKSKAIDGFVMAEHFPRMYEWPIVASYQFRNCCVHDGGYIEGIPFFKGRAVDEAFLIDGEAVNKLNEVVEKRICQKTSSFCFSVINGECKFADGDIRPQLKAINDEIDVALSSLLQWCVEAFVLQVKVFSERDFELP